MFYETAPGCCILHCFDRPFLPSQLVYGGKATKSFPQVYFLSLFFKMSTKNAIVIKSNPLDIVITYTVKEKKNFCYHQTDLQGQMTEKVLKALQDNDIILITVPASLTYLSQQLDVQFGRNGAS